MDKYLSKKYLQRMIDKWKSQYEDFEGENKNSKLRKKLILKGYNECETIIEQAPTADVAEVKTIEAWLYEIAKNNIGIDNNLSNACVEIISRLDGLRRFAQERSDTY